MQYNGIGFSNIRIPENISLYKYDVKRNTFPEEVYLHEFLHTLERNSIERGYNIPLLHNNEKYGYYKDNKNGLKDWYKAYMNKTIEDDSSDSIIGLSGEIYKYKPINETNFENEIKLDLLEEPENIIKQLEIVIKKIKEIINGG